MTGEVVEPDSERSGDIEQHIGSGTEVVGTIVGAQDRAVTDRAEGGGCGALEHGRHVAEYRPRRLHDREGHAVAFDPDRAVAQHEDRTEGRALFDEGVTRCEPPSGQIRAPLDGIAHRASLAVEYAACEASTDP